MRMEKGKYVIEGEAEEIIDFVGKTGFDLDRYFADSKKKYVFNKFDFGSIILFLILLLPLLKLDHSDNYLFIVIIEICLIGTILSRIQLIFKNLFVTGTILVVFIFSLFLSIGLYTIQDVKVKGDKAVNKILKIDGTKDSK
ncbi:MULTISPECIES: hypothetical protein [Psychrilyobacter]|uniref:Uncharacterized protein n=1 Tax=Psychrilyobacter piezotolerans TaxID=2293438 RepID=A0ABX9KDL2_9FUSO|nr:MULTISPECIES: hypothetical protein [Psychrilyobacter]MCS5423085.1 hypothetical protein [Psychrilyobacter sp. S5]NDI79151.1 hypothetical protein [Psychrilyobacter piezotolerans]RDE58949.1 hypothetical protein DV867_14640 [Psychrilyobacter sp. S5]REI39505.1 hypothetical protein DYH56_14640 [Psychrilyobacter piezotolerans]